MSIRYSIDMSAAEKYLYQSHTQQDYIKATRWLDSDSEKLCNSITDALSAGRADTIMSNYRETLRVPDEIEERAFAIGVFLAALAIRGVGDAVNFAAFTRAKTELKRQELREMNIHNGQLNEVEYGRQLCGDEVLEILNTVFDKNFHDYFTKKSTMLNGFFLIIARSELAREYAAQGRVNVEFNKIVDYAMNTPNE